MQIFGRMWPNRLVKTLLFAFSVIPSTVVAQDNLALGRSLYRMGSDLDGNVVSATVMNDITLRGMMVACAKCHRRSGFGNEEPGKLTPSITASELFSSKTFQRARQFRSLYQEPQTEVERAGPRIPHDRSAYTESSLTRAIRDGIDPSGRVLDPLMPRYQLDDGSMASLISYLRRLSSRSDPGVDSTTIHFAFVTTDDVDPDARIAVQRVMNAYVSDHNREVIRYRMHEGYSPNYKDDFIASYRQWQIHEWRLSGEPYTYGEQLSRYLRAQPVFAMLAGASNQSWQPIQRFCDRHELPCLFPNTPLPASDADGGYTLYLTGGLRAEADTFCEEIMRTKTEEPSVGRIHQFAIADSTGEQAMRYTTSKLCSHGIEPIDHLLPPSPDLDHALISPRQPRDVGLIWIDERQMPPAEVWQRIGFAQLYFSGTLLPDPPDDFATVPHLAMLSPYRDEAIEHPRAYRVRSWMRSRRIPLTHRRLQDNAYFALTVTDHALRHMVDRYSRDYLIERIEHETENSLNPGVYPTLSLGPQQRYASRTVRIISWPPQRSSASPRR